MGGVYVNDERVTVDDSNNLEFLQKNRLAERFLVLRIGKKNYYLLEII